MALLVLLVNDAVLAVPDELLLVVQRQFECVGDGQLLRCDVIQTGAVGELILLGLLTAI